MKTRIVGLKGVLIREEDEGTLSELVAYADFIRFHAYNLLGVYATLVAADVTPDRMEGDSVFSQVVISQALAIVFNDNNVNVNISQIMRRAEDLYFVGDLLRIRTHFPDGRVRDRARLYGAKFADEMAIQIVTAFQNCLNLSSRDHQKQYLKAVYGVSAPNATALANLLSLSDVQRNTAAIEAHVKTFQAAETRLYHLLQRAMANHMPRDLVQQLREQKEQATRQVVIQRAAAVANPALALASLRAANPLDNRKHQKRLRDNRDAAVGLFPVMSLQDILDVELPRIPALHYQAPLLRYRYALLQQLEALVDIERVKLFNLVPIAKFHRTFHLLDKGLLAHLAPRVLNEVTGRMNFVAYGEGVTLAALLPLSFNMDKLNKLLPRWGGLDYGASLKTDGIQLQVNLVTPAQAAKKRRRLENAAANRALRAAGEDVPARVARLPENVEAALVRRRRYEVAREALKARLYIIPPNSLVIGCDPGRRNIITYCPEIINPVTLTCRPGVPIAISLKRYRQETGISPQVKAQGVHLARYRPTHPEFVASETAVTAARTKSANQVQLLDAMKVRGLHFDTLYAFYALEANARMRFVNYMGAQSFADKLANEIFERPGTVLVVGDGDLWGAARRVITRLGQRGDVRFVDEYRTTLLDSRWGHAMLYSPPKEIVEKELRNGGRSHYLKRVQGLKQCASPGSSYLWNRDKNAAINILQNFVSMSLNGEVNERFRRGFDLEKPRSFYYGYVNRMNGGAGFKRYMMRGWVEPQ